MRQIVDKHGFSRNVFNAKINIHRQEGEPIFLGLQVEEYIHAYTEMGLRLDAGIYGSLFFMLTGFHGAHVTMGTIMLAVMLLRSLRGHFSAENHFAFEAVSWYWHFVDVVWLFLFTFVYWF
jgi:cytochrome c oxidase subunit 3